MMSEELEASPHEKEEWENLQEISGWSKTPPAFKTIDFEGWVVRDGVRKALRDRQLAPDRTGSRDPRIPDDCGEQTADVTGFRIHSRGPRTEQGN
jgi:hypothetical protein